MFTDMVGSTVLMQRDEDLGLEVRREHEELLRKIFPKHEGREGNHTGDGFLVLFPSVLAAAKCALEAQRSILNRNASAPPARRYEIRIGIHLGDVEIENGNPFGSTVNIASRVVSHAEPGGIVITRQVADLIRNRSFGELQSIGEKKLKGINSPMELFRLRESPDLATPKAKWWFRLWTGFKVVVPIQARVKPRLLIGAALVGLCVPITLYFTQWQAPWPDVLHPPKGWARMWYPQEKNPRLRLPKVPNVNLQDIYFSEDDNGTELGWAVGEQGTILHTSDGGRSWLVQTSNVPHNLHAIRVMTGGRGWIVGDAGTILHTTNWGRSWAAQANTNEANLRGLVFLPDGSTGWAVGEGGTILATIDGGQTWRSEPCPVPADLAAVTADIWERTRVWAVGKKGTIVFRDGGTWLPVFSGTESNLLSIEFLSRARRGWCVGEGGTLLQGSSFGTQWRSHASGVLEDLTAVVLAKNGHGWIVGRKGRLLRTDNAADAMATWHSIELEENPDLARMAIAPARSEPGSRAWAAGAHGTILNTVDSGKNWRPQTSNMRPKEFRGACFWPDQKTGWVVADDGSILHTSDAGLTWMEQKSGTKRRLLGVAVAPNGRGWAVGWQRTLLRTVDGGQTWSQQVNNEVAPFWGIAALSDGETAWVVGPSRTILKTTNGGLTWVQQPVPSGTGGGLESIGVLPDGRHGWIGGVPSVILRTTNGGDFWERPGIETIGQVGGYLTGFAFLDEGLRGWASELSGSIFYTSDGGLTWIDQGNRRYSELRAIAVVKNGKYRGLHGWAAGSEGTILSTTDGGQSWRPQPTGVKADLYTVSFPSDELQGWATGAKSTILRTIDGGKTWDDPRRYDRKPAPALYICLSALAAGIFVLRRRILYSPSARSNTS